MTLRRAKRMNANKLMIFANLSYVRSNLDNLPKWKKKNWWHGGNKGKGKPVANHETWQEINSHLLTVEIVWMWDPNGKTYQSVKEKATSMALLHEQR